MDISHNNPDCSRRWRNNRQRGFADPTWRCNQVYIREQCQLYGLSTVTGTCCQTVSSLECPQHLLVLWATSERFSDRVIPLSALLYLWIKLSRWRRVDITDIVQQVLKLVFIVYASDEVRLLNTPFFCRTSEPGEHKNNVPENTRLHVTNTVSTSVRGPTA